MFEQLNPYALSLIISALISGVTAFYSWRRRPAPGAALFALLMLAITVWTLGYGLELTCLTLACMLFWIKIEYLGIATLPGIWMAFTLQFTGHETWLTWRRVALLFVVPAITLVINWTNEFHYWHYRSVAVNTSSPFPLLAITRGPWYWTHIAYFYLMLLAGTILLWQMFRRSAGLYRRQAGFILMGALAPWAVNIAYMAGLRPFAYLDLTPFAFTVTGSAAGWGLFRYRLLDIVPVARDKVLESMRDGVLVLDMQARIVDANPAALQFLDRSAREVIGQPAAQILSRWPDLLERYKDVYEAQTQIVLDNELSPRYHDLRISPLYERRGELTGRLIVLHDITERKQAEEALVLAHDQALEASRLKSELLANVSHDLRTPLTSILGYTDLLEAGGYGPLSDKQQTVVTRIMVNTKQLLLFINNILDQAQIDAGKVELRVSSFNPSNLIETIQSTMSVLAQAKGLELTGHVASEVLPTLSGDFQRLQAILMNLVSNGIKFTKQGTVHIHIYQPDADHWALQVCDTGSGIPRQAQTYIFEPFRQVDGSLTRAQTGTGLGLSIVKQLTTLMGGEITLESEVGRGSIFTVSLPLQPIPEKIA